LIVVLANLLEDPEVRRRAADALGQIGDSQAVPHLITAMEDADWQVRFAALAVFSMVDDPQTLGDLIIAAMEDEAWRVRTRAAGAAAVLSRKGDPRAFDILIGALADRDANVRGAAARACAEAKDPRTVMRLTEVLRKDTDSYGRSEAAKALGKLGDPRAIEPLREAIREDEDNGVRTASRHALQQIREAQQMPPNK